MATFTDLITSVATSMGLAAGLTQISLVVQERLRRRRALKQAEEEHLNRVIDSLDIDVMASYLENDLGSVSLSTYAGDDEVRKRVDLVLTRLAEYVGTDVSAELADTTSVPLPADVPGLTPNIGLVEVDNLFVRARVEIINGEVWNGLARLRRGIEVALQELARDNGIDPARRGPTRLVRSLANKGVVPPGALSHLLYAIEVASRGIHGEDIEADQAEEAFNSAVMGLRLIGEHR